MNASSFPARSRISRASASERSLRPTGNRVSTAINGTPVADFDASELGPQAEDKTGEGDPARGPRAEKGYIGYAKGKAQSTVTYPTHTGTYGFAYNRSTWDDVLRPYHDLPVVTPVEFAAGARIVTLASAAMRTTASKSWRSSSR